MPIELTEPLVHSTGLYDPNAPRTESSTQVDHLQIASLVAHEHHVVRGARFAARHVGRVPLDDEGALGVLRIAAALGEGLSIPDACTSSALFTLAPLALPIPPHALNALHALNAFNAPTTSPTIPTPTKRLMLSPRPWAAALLRCSGDDASRACGVRPLYLLNVGACRCARRRRLLRPRGWRPPRT
jgi:hypothetical protein